MTALLLALVLPALAQDGTSRLVITVDKPVGLMVDGHVVDYAEDGPVATADGLQPGKHQISVRTMLNKELWSGLVETPNGYEVRCQWKASKFTCYDAVAMVPPAPAPAPGPAPAYAQVVVTPPPAATTTTTRQTTTTTGVSMGVSAPGMPFFGIVVDDVPVTTTTTTTITTVAPPPPPAAPPPPPRAVPSKVKLTVRSLDGEWADVRVDGKVVLELRNQDEGEVWIAPGLHQVEVNEFMADKPYATGRLDTAYDDHVTLGIRENTPVTCYDSKGWTSL